MLKRFSYLLALSITLSSACNKKSSGTNDPYAGLPRTEVPAPLLLPGDSRWWQLEGGLNRMFDNFWGDHTSDIVGNTASGQRYRFYKDGRYELYTYVAINNGCGGLKQSYGYYKGTVEVNTAAETITFHPAEGRKKYVNYCNAGENYDRNANKTELSALVAVYNWSVTNPAGFEILNLREPTATRNVQYTIKP
jgi:hypothetical protein